MVKKLLKDLTAKVEFSLDGIDNTVDWEISHKYGLHLKGNLKDGIHTTKGSVDVKNMFSEALNIKVEGDTIKSTGKLSQGFLRRLDNDIKDDIDNDIK